MEFDFGISITRFSILAPWGNAQGGWLGRCDLETWDFPGDAAEFQQIIGEHGRADFSRCEGYEYIVHRPQAIVYSRGIAIHRSKESSGMVECGGCEAEGTPGVKGLLNPVDGFLRLRRICAEPEFQ